jgi:hypothetical protein
MRIVSLAAVALAAALAVPAAAQAPAPGATTGPAPLPPTFRCPDTITVEEQPVAPPGTRAAPGRSQRRFMAVDFFDGDYGDRSGALAPDSDGRRRGNVVTQVFTFSRERPRPLYGRCAYRDTDAAVYVDVPPTVTRCTLVFVYNQRTGAVGTPQRPQTVECR